MFSKYKHGGGYRQAALKEGINWKLATDYSTSINWKATEFYPEHLIYLHQESIEYPDANYTELTELIGETYNLSPESFLLTHGANEAISSLFHMFLLQDYKDKQVVLVGSTYSEYNKYTDLNGFDSVKLSFEDFNSKLSSLKDKIIVIVNPNTPFGFYFDLRHHVEKLLSQGSIVVIDESFIDFTEKPSVADIIHPNLYIIKSLTKFYGSAGARLGLVISSNPLLKSFLSVLLPPWNISAYDNWFYKTMLIHYNKIRKATLEWVNEINSEIDKILKGSKNVLYFPESVTSYRTLEISEKFLIENNIEDFRKFFLKEYNVYIRPTADFFGCSKNSFRVGLRLPQENIPLLKAIKDIG
ncbi:MAG: hypothetical protein A2287_03190 [Candidatus Melainabacteria bacterium RIFOXYA12_FULL_32_12]|nr:MAG: hypothetical protein A2255_06835 [Candidatus Melainabacteria bacterium RIFOXYA2_FULL_32_9]OGI28088.1 MAG: hypothetical protein A2287_03190 [Candidatus Melainabacteria bacterium RIFOXYA12_FULL_32_12]